MPRNSLNNRQIWAIPIILGLSSAAGLMAALLGDGLYDLVSWLALALPIVVVSYFVASPQNR